MIAGVDSAHYGEARNSWLSGTAATNLQGITQYMLGIKPDYNGLKIEPCLPTSWGNCRVKRCFRGNTYVINIDNPDGVSQGELTIEVDGKKISGNIIPITDKGQTHNVNVTMKKKVSSENKS
jgi:cellobiose phosphorylase